MTHSLRKLAVAESFLLFVIIANHGHHNGRGHFGDLSCHCGIEADRGRTTASGSGTSNSSSRQQSSIHTSLRMLAIITPDRLCAQTSLGS